MKKISDLEPIQEAPKKKRTKKPFKNYDDFLNRFTDSHAIRIYGNIPELKNYEPALFFMLGDDIYTSSTECGIFKRSNNDMTKESLYKHIEKMLKEGFTIDFI